MKSLFEKLMNLDNVYNIEKLINEDNFKLSFNKTYFDSVQNKTLPGETVIIDNDKTFLDMYISQEFLPLKKFFEVVETKKIVNKIEETDSEYLLRMISVRKAKINILKIFHQIAYYKGTAEYILFFTRFFVKLRGYDLSEKTKVDILDNYCYSVTANCSLEEWEEILKPIVHPIGFSCSFLSIDGQDFSSFVQLKNFDISTKTSKLDVGFRNLNSNCLDNLNFEELSSGLENNFKNSFWFDNNGCPFPYLREDDGILTSSNDNVKYLTVSKTVKVTKVGDVITVGSSIYSPVTLFAAGTDLTNLTIDNTKKYILLRRATISGEVLYSQVLIFQKV